MKFPDRLITKFELVKQLPSNKPFDVFLVKDKTKDLRPCVLRLLPASLSGDKAIVDTFMAYFSKFSEIINRAYIPTVYSVSGQVGGNVYVLEEHVSGIDLRKFVQKHRDNPGFNKEIISVIGKVCEALHHAHQKDLFHLAITPEDILIDEMTGRVKLFGFGTQIFSQLNKMGILSAQARKTIAPEILTGSSFKPYADVYSLAKAINEACPDIFFKTSVLTRALANNPLARHLSARDFQSALNKLLQGIQKIPVGKPKETPLESKGGLKPVWSKAAHREGRDVCEPHSSRLASTAQAQSHAKPDCGRSWSLSVLLKSFSTRLFLGATTGLLVLAIGLGISIFHDRNGSERILLGHTEKPTNDVDKYQQELKWLSGDGAVKLRWGTTLGEEVFGLWFVNGLLMTRTVNDKLIAVNATTGEKMSNVFYEDVKHPVAYDGLFCFRDKDRCIKCLEPQSQRIKFNISKKTEGPMAVKGDTLFTYIFAFPSPTKLVALNLKTGSERWTYEFDDADHGLDEIFIQDNSIYTWTWRDAKGEVDGEHRGTILCLDLMTGKFNWRLKSHDWIGNTFVVDSGMLYYMVFKLPEMKMRCFESVETKRLVPQWISHHFKHPSSLVKTGNIIIVADISILRALSANTGKDLWNAGFGDKEIACTPVVIHDMVYVITREGQLYALDTVSGNIKWVVKIIGDSLDRCCVDMIGTDDGILYCADRSTGYLFSIDTK